MEIDYVQGMGLGTFRKVEGGSENKASVFAQ